MLVLCSCSFKFAERERERELRREGGKSLLAYVKGVDPHLIHIDRPTTIRSPEHISGWVNYPPAYVIWVDGCVAFKFALHGALRVHLHVGGAYDPILIV